MNTVASLILGAAALLIHAGLLLVATPFLTPDAAGRFPWRSPGLWQNWLRAAPGGLLRLARKEPVRAETASLLARAAPVAALAPCLMAALLVPSFATGMLDWPMADLAVVLALLGCAKLVWLLSAADLGAAAPGLAAVSATVDGMLAVPGLILGAAILALLAGGTGFDQILVASRASIAPGMIMAAAAIAVAACASARKEAGLARSMAGPDLAAFRFEAGLRTLVWIDLIGALAWPDSLAPAQSGPVRWLLALALWGVRLVVGMAIVGLVRSHVTTEANRRRLAGLSVVLALLAPILLLAAQEPR